MGRLFVVATPLGNLEDLSPRATRTLCEAKVVFAEDTRVTGPLLQRIGSHARLVALHAHNEAQASEQLCKAIDEHELVALVSDAGTPLVSDPGSRAVSATVEAGHEVIPIPGPSAVTAALSAAGFLAVPFAFFGFFERQNKEQNAQILQIAAWPGAAVFFETKHRIADTLERLRDRLGSDRQVAVFRELTKMHEQHYRGTLAELAKLFADTEVKGELTVVLAPPTVHPNDAHESVDDVVQALAQDTRTLSDKAKELASRTGLTRSEAYDRLRRK